MDQAAGDRRQVVVHEARSREQRGSSRYVNGLDEYERPTSAGQLQGCRLARLFHRIECGWRSRWAAAVGEMVGQRRGRRRVGTRYPSDRAGTDCEARERHHA